MQIINAVSPSFARMPPVVSAKKMDQADSVVPKLDLIAGALEMKLVMLSIELSGVIDQALEARMQSQKDRNAQIENLNDLLNALRKLQKSSATFSADSLDKTYIDLPLDARSGPERAMRRKEKEIQKEQEIAAADAAEETVCKEVETWGNKSTSFLESYSAIERFMDIKSRSARADGSIAYTGINRTTGQWETQYLKAHTNFWYPSWGPDKIRAAYADRRFATARIESKYKINSDSDKTSLADLLYQYGVYKKGEALPATKEAKLSHVEQASDRSGTETLKAKSQETLSLLQLANEIQQAFNCPPDPQSMQSQQPATLRIDSDVAKALRALFIDRSHQQGGDLESLLCELEKLQHDTAQRRVESQQVTIAANRDARSEQIDKRMKAITAASRAKVEREAAEKNLSIWSKLSKGLSIIVAVMGIALAPFTGGLSLAATAFMALDLGLDLGEYCSGVKMSLQSGLQIVCEKVIDAIANGSGTQASREMAASIVSAVLNFAIMVAATVLTFGGGAPKLFAVINKNVEKIASKILVTKACSYVQKGAHAANASASIYTGVCGMETANAGFELTSSEVQKLEIEKLQTWLEKLLEQCTEDLKLVAKELQRSSELLGEILSGSIDNRKSTINGLFGRQSIAA